MTSQSDAPLNGDLSIPIVLESESMEWTSSPGSGVVRKRLHRVGPAESGQVTSIVRYEPGASFPAHDHPEGEEILVLEGVFSDEHGDWPAGTYLLNPEGFRHAPFSRDGCLLFVKLRQAAEPERIHVAVQTESLAWQATAEPGIEIKALYVQPDVEETTRLERWEPNCGPVHREFAMGAELFVLDGVFSDSRGDHGRGTWLRYPTGSSVRAETPSGCTLYVKNGGVAILRSA